MRGLPYALPEEQVSFRCPPHVGWAGRSASEQLFRLFGQVTCGLRPRLILVLLAGFGFFLCLAAGRANAQATADVVRGGYVFTAAGCLGCHTQPDGGERLAGGRALQTPFGTFYSPNITTDAAQGIGKWGFEQFLAALRHGRGPDGNRLYPAFPYGSYAYMSDRDAEDLWAYLRAQPASTRQNRPHEIRFPFSIRPLLAIWQWLYLNQRPLTVPARSDLWQRGRYLVDVLGHCGECHTPRNWLGGPRFDAYLSGTPLGPEGLKVPGISRRAGQLTEWGEEDIADYLEHGITPSGDAAGAGMSEVIREVTSKLTPADRRAIAAYVADLPY